MLLVARGAYVSLRGVNVTGSKSSGIAVFGGALDAVGGWVREKGAMHAALSAGLGLAGLAIGVPCVPGVTDNLVIGAVGAVLPQLGWPLKAPDDEGE